MKHPTHLIVARTTLTFPGGSVDALRYADGTIAYVGDVAGARAFVGMLA